MNWFVTLAHFSPLPLLQMIEPLWRKHVCESMKQSHERVWRIYPMQVFCVHFQMVHGWVLLDCFMRFPLLSWQWRIFASRLAVLFYSSHPSAFHSLPFFNSITFVCHSSFFCRSLQWNIIISKLVNDLAAFSPNFGSWLSFFPSICYFSCLLTFFFWSLPICTLQLSSPNQNIIVCLSFREFLAIRLFLISAASFFDYWAKQSTTVFYGGCFVIHFE